MEAVLNRLLIKWAFFPQNGVFWHPSGFAAGGMLRRCHFMLPKFLPFYEILNLTLTLYLKAKPSVETGAVSSIYKSGIKCFSLLQVQSVSEVIQRKTKESCCECCCR